MGGFWIFFSDSKRLQSVMEEYQKDSRLLKLKILGHKFRAQRPLYVVLFFPNIVFGFEL